MNIEYGIKNFRVFDKDGERFNLKPITMLTGANCAGKSSLVKSIMLLKQYLDKVYADKILYPGAHNISFTDQSININGIDTVLNNKSDGYKDVVFSLSKPGTSDNVKFTTEYTFSSAKGDYFNNGWLKSIRFACAIDGVSDVFFHVDFEDYFPVFRMLKLEGNIQKVFQRDLDLITYLFYFSVLRKPLDENDSVCIEELRCFRLLVNRIINILLNSALPLFRKPRKRKGINGYSDTILPKKELERLDKVLHYINYKQLPVMTLQRLLDADTLFYIPAVERIGAMSPEELEKYLLNKELISNLFPISKIVSREDDSGTTATFNNEGRIKDIIDDYTRIVKSVIDDFKGTLKNSFREYYNMLSHMQANNLANCEEPKYFFFKEGFLKVINGLFTLPIDIPRSVNAREQVFNTECDYLDFELTLFQKVYYILSCLQRQESKKETIIGHSSDLLEQPLYKLESDVTFEWRERNWTNPRYTTENVDVPVPNLYYNFFGYLENIISNLCNIEDFQHISQYDSFLCPVQRSYSVYDKTPLNKLLVEYIGLREQNKAAERKTKVRFIDKWVKELGIGESIIFELNKEKTDIKIIVKDFSGNKISSADLGHGVTQMLSILINIERHIYEKGGQKTPYTICIEEPEVSLHPSWQSALGRIFYDAAVNYGIHFIIETHSEYLIRATQAIVANTVNTEYELNAIPFVVYYIENGGKAYDMEYQVSGRFNKPFGTGFFDEAGKSSLEIIRKERRMADGKDA